MKYKDFLEKLTDYNYKNNIPGMGFFELTPLCNLDCKMCYVHLQDPSIRERLLTGKQWIALMEDAIRHGMIRALLSGGEAMTHPDFWEIYMFLVNHGVPVHLKSNGVLLNGETLERFKKYPPEWIDVSLYGCDRASYVAVTGHDVYEKVVANLRSVREARLPLRLAITPSRQMLPWAEGVMRLADSFDVSVIVSNFLNEPNENTGRHKESFSLTAEEYLAIDKLKDEIFPAEYIQRDEYEPDEDKPRPASSENRTGLRCKAGRSTFCVNWDGTMSPCASFPREIVLAEPMVTGFKVAWETVNACVRSYEVPEKCHECVIGARCVYCPVKHRKTSPRHQCDEDVCRYLMDIRRQD